MKRFEFPLQRVAEWREKQLAVEESKLERLNMDLRILDARRLALDTEQAATDGALTTAVTLTAAELHQLDAFHRYASKQRILIASQRAQAERKIEEQRAALVKARRDVQLLERLRDRRLAAWQIEYDRELEQQAAEAHLSRTHTVIEEGPRFAQE